MKKWAAVFLAAGMVLALARCGEREAAMTPTPTPSQAVTPMPTPEPTSAPTPEPTSTKEPISPAELEFSIVIGDQILTLGEQSGEFPWGTDLEADSEEYWSSDGFHSFELTCGADLLLGGFRPEKYVETTENAVLRAIENRNPDYKTYRGAYIGMSLEDFLELYPDAEEVSSGRRYDYIDPPNCFLKQHVFYFEGNQLVEFKIAHGVDDWAY